VNGALDGEPRQQRVQGGVGSDVGGSGVDLFAPHKARCLALFHDGIEEATEGVYAVPLPDLGQA